MTITLTSLPNGTTRTARSDEHARRSETSSELVYFAHLARLSLPLSSLDARDLREVRRDLGVLVAESTRTRLRPRLLDALLDAVLDDLLPALPPGSRHALLEARPTLAVTTDSAS